jgi:hypothetical protein
MQQFAAAPQPPGYVPRWEIWTGSPLKGRSYIVATHSTPKWIEKLDNSNMIFQASPSMKIGIEPSKHRDLINE